MSILKSCWLPGALLALVGTTATSQAVVPVPTELTKPVQTGAALNDEALLQMIRGMGYEPYQTGTFTEGGNYYWVKMKQDTWTVNVRFAISGSKKVLWLTTYLGEVPATAEILPDALRKMIESQNDSKGRFWISKTKLYYQMPVDNHDVTPHVLREWIDEILTVVKGSAEVWKTEKWTRAGKEAEALKQLDVAGRRGSPIRD